MVGMAALILVSSVMFWLSSKGTFKSALTNTFFPFKSAPLNSPTLFFAIDTTARVPFVLIELTLDATWQVSSGSAAENPSLRDAEVGMRRKEARGEERDELAAVLMREKVVGLVAEAIDVAGVEGRSKGAKDWNFVYKVEKWEVGFGLIEEWGSKMCGEDEEDVDVKSEEEKRLGDIGDFSYRWGEVQDDRYDDDAFQVYYIKIE